MNAGEFAAKRARINQEAWRRSPTFAKRALARLVREAGAKEIVNGCGKHLGWRMPNGQVVCRKETFKTQEAADREMARVAEFIDSNRSKAPVRAYQCPSCHHWHLTSIQ